MTDQSSTKRPNLVVVSGSQDVQLAKDVMNAAFDANVLVFENERDVRAFLSENDAALIHVNSYIRAEPEQNDPSRFASHDLLEWIPQQVRHRNTPIIFITGAIGIYDDKFTNLIRPNDALWGTIVYANTPYPIRRPAAHFTAVWPVEYTKEISRLTGLPIKLTHLAQSGIPKS